MSLRHRHTDESPRWEPLFRQHGRRTTARSDGGMEWRLPVIEDGMDVVDHVGLKLRSRFSDVGDAHIRESRWPRSLTASWVEPTRLVQLQ